MKKNKTLKKYFIISIPMCILLFLSGKIVYIPFGTKQGGIVGVIGISLIFTFLFVIYKVTHFLLNKYKKNNT